MTPKKYILGALIVALASGITGGIAWAQTTTTQATACAKSNGTIYLIGSLFSRQTCVAGEQEISWPTLAGTPKTKKVYDGENNFMGDLTYANQSQTDVVYTIWYEPLKIFLTYNGSSQRSISLATYSVANQFSLYYENPDCIGQTFSRSFGEWGGYYPEPSFPLGIGGKLYVGTSSPEVLITALSVENELGCQNIISEQHSVYPLIEVIIPESIIGPVWPLQIVEE